MLLKIQYDNLGHPVMLLKMNEVGQYAVMYLKTREIAACEKPIPEVQSKQEQLARLARRFMKISELMTDFGSRTPD